MVDTIQGLQTAVAALGEGEYLKYFYIHLFWVFRPMVVHHPPVGRTERQWNISFLPETFFLFCQQIPPSSPSATAV